MVIFFAFNNLPILIIALEVRIKEKLETEIQYALDEIEIRIESIRVELDISNKRLQKRLKLFSKRAE